MRFAPRKTASRKTCCVFDCKSCARKDDTVRFHIPPKSGLHKVKVMNKLNQEEIIDRRLAWLRALNMKEFLKCDAVCSLHFVKEDYFRPDLQPKQNNLKKSAVPSVNLPHTKLTRKEIKKKENNLKREERLMKRSVKKNNGEEVDQPVEKNVDKVEICGKKSAPKDKISKKSVPDNAMIFNDKANPDGDMIVDVDIVNIQMIEDMRMTEDKQTTVEFYLNFVTTEQHLYTMTGLLSFEILNTLDEIVEIVMPSKTSAHTKLSQKDRIIMTLMKMKQNFDYNVLCAMFQVLDVRNCRETVLEMIEILGVGLKFAIRWPSKQEHEKNISSRFNKISNMKAAVGIIEVPIQKPSNLCCHLESFSHYINKNSVKFITAVSPSGMITFVSKPFCGKSTDIAILKEYDLIKTSNENDVSLKEARFSISDIQSIRSPFLENKIPLLNNETVKSHAQVNCPNQGVKSFKIIDNIVPSCLVPKMELIFTIICAILNFNLVNSIR